MQPKPPNIEAQDPWEVCNSFAKKGTEEHYESLKDEVDKLLIFAGLFSAVVTAFIVESYRFAREDPAETTVLLLRSISLQLDNMTHPRPNAPIDFFTPSPDMSGSARRINAFWFLSLTLSLSTTVAGILCLQWIREYRRKVNVSNREDIALHNLRREGMEKWQVFRFLNSLPLLLLVALLLFFAGLIEFLRQVDGIVAILVSLVVGIVSLFVIATTMLPGLQYLYLSAFPATKVSHCPYKSPQSWIYYNALTLFSSLFQSTKRRSAEPLTRPTLTKSWSDYDHSLWSLRHDSDLPDLDIGRGLAWVGESFGQNQDLVEAVSRCLQDLDPRVALDGVLAPVNRHRAARVRRTQYRLRSTELDARSYCSQPPRQKIDITRDLVVSHTLEHFSEKIGQKYVSPSLLQRRLNLFLTINEREDIDSDLDCPINHDNVMLIDRDTRERVLWCINTLLQMNLNCNDTHLKGAFEIIKSIFTETHDHDPITPVVSDTFIAILAWVERDPINPFAGKPPEKRLKQAIPFHKLLFACKGEKERDIVEQFCRALDTHIERVFGREVDAAGDSEKSFTKTVEFDFLARYMTWRGLG